MICFAFFFRLNGYTYLPPPPYAFKSQRTIVETTRLVFANRSEMDWLQPMPTYHQAFVLNINVPSLSLQFGTLEYLTKER